LKQYFKMAQQSAAPIATQQHWVQCENPNCNKWRLLPPGTEVNENEAWYCYMNPDPDKNTCSASEAVSRKSLMLLSIVRTLRPSASIYM